jgi:hypothetical protein
MHTYKIHARPRNSGGGWNLKLYEDFQDAGGGAYPVRQEDPHVGMEWWNGLSETRRALAHNGRLSHAGRSATCLSASGSLQRCYG